MNGENTPADQDIKKRELSNRINSVKEIFSKSNYKYIYILIIVGFVFLFIFQLVLNINSIKNSDLLQEQINYFYERDKQIEKNIVRLINYQNDLVNRITEQNFDEFAIGDLKKANEEEVSPFDHIKSDDIIVTHDRVIIKDKDLNWAEYSDTGSMSPILTSSANGIEIAPKDPTDIHVGDIISYHHHDIIVAHRVIKIGIDDIGWYAITKADNSEKEDPSKVRFDQVNGILIGIIY